MCRLFNLSLMCYSKNTEISKTAAKQIFKFLNFDERKIRQSNPANEPD